MRFLAPLLLIVVLSVSSTFCDEHVHTRRRADPGPYPVARPEPQQLSERSLWGMIPSLSDLVSKFLPDAGGIFSMTKNLLAGTPARLVILYVNQVCSVASKIGLLKQNYVPEKADWQLQLHTANHVVTAPFNRPSILLESEHFNPNANVTVFVSGWESATSNKDPNDPVYRMIDAYQRRGNTNFIVFDAGRLINNLYHWATLNVIFLGGELGNSLVQLANKVPAERIHVVGHSIGAHIAGVAGRRVQGSTGQQLARITGLDPALPCLDSSISLQKGDASFVDVIHTSSGALGKKEATGDADFYPNGPVPLPPGCLDVVCAHNRAVYYYAESVLPGSEDNFLAVRCTSVSEYSHKNCKGTKIAMGYTTPSYVRGIYYLETNSKSPYGQNSA